MLGRAGRRGQDKVGFSLWADAAMFRRFGKAHREPCESKLRNDPATFLGLVARDFSLDDIERFYERSFRHFRRQTRDLKIISPTHLRAALKTSDLPCASPAGAFTSFLIGENRPTPCAQCRLRKDCHHLLKKSGEGALAALQMHLHAIKALDDEGRLTPFGSTARFLPQFGGLLLARMMTDGRLHDRNPLAAAELMGALSLAAHKDPSDNNDTPSRKTDEPTLSNYQLPFNETDLREELEELYPEELFPEVYELSRDRRRVEGLRDFNTAGGFIASEWGRGAPWPQMSTRCTSRYFGAGDLMNLLLRVSTYMHSVSQAAPEPMKLSLSALRREWLRDPLATASF
jgi:superfamily II RNA helicase